MRYLIQAHGGRFSPLERTAFILTCTFLALLGSSATAAELYNSGGFEPPRFTTGNLGGQDVAQGPWLKDSGTATAVVQTAVAAGGLSAVQITRPATSSGDTRWAVSKPF